MERVRAVGVCLAYAGLWWGGFGRHWWHRYHVSAAMASGWVLVIGCCLWIPSWRGLAFGSGLTALAMGWLRWHLRLSGWLPTTTVAVLSLLGFVHSANEAISAGNLTWMLGLIGALLSKDPVEALAGTATGILSAECLAKYGFQNPADLLNRSGLAIAVLSALIAWTGRTVVAQGSSWWDSMHKKH